MRRERGTCECSKVDAGLASCRRAGLRCTGVSGKYSRRVGRPRRERGRWPTRPALGEPSQVALQRKAQTEARELLRDIFWRRPSWLAPAQPIDPQVVTAFLARGARQEPPSDSWSSLVCASHLAAASSKEPRSAAV